MTEIKRITGIDFTQPLRITTLGGPLGQSSHDLPPRVFILGSADGEGWRDVHEEGGALPFEKCKLVGTVHPTCPGPVFPSNSDHVEMRPGHHVGLDFGDEKKIYITTRMISVVLYEG